MLEILEVVIGLAFVFAFVSLLSSMINEWFAGVLAMRGRMLWRGVKNLVGSELGQQVHEHPLVAGLKHPTWFAGLSRLLRLNTAWPAYVPTQTFVLGLLSSLDEEKGLPTDAEGLRGAVEKIEDKAVRRALLTLVDNAAGDFEQAKQGIGDWFDASMDEVSGWYKRWSQTMLLGISLAVAMVMGVDSLQIGEELWTDDELRGRVVAAATDYLEQHSDSVSAAAPAVPPTVDASGAAAQQAVAADQTAGGDASGASEVSDREELEALVQEFQDLDLPLISLAEARRKYPEASFLAVFWQWLSGHFLGFLLTGLAASLGAPFWFDLLNRFVNLRAGFKKAV